MRRPRDANADVVIPWRARGAKRLRVARHSPKSSDVCCRSLWSDRASTGRRQAILLAARDGSVWIGMLDELYRWKDGSVASVAHRSGASARDLAAADGAVPRPPTSAAWEVSEPVSKVPPTIECECLIDPSRSCERPACRTDGDCRRTHCSDSGRMRFARLHRPYSPGSSRTPELAIPCTRK